ncbi:MAG TPA: ABC transporter ATP-binding protein [Aggregatilineales bacterium]|nr:ABC transporter ATP-binding protein [Aggregatilineales bacterium]
MLRSIGYMRRYLALAVLGLISSVAAMLFALLVPQILREVIDLGLPQPIERAIFLPRFLSDGLEIVQPRPPLIFLAAGALLTLSLFRAAVAFGQRYFSDRLSHWVVYDIRNEFYDKVQRLPFIYHDQSQMGQIITRAISDMDAIRNFISMGLTECVNIIILLVGVVGAMLSLSPRLTVVALLPVPLIMATAAYMGILQIPRWKNVMNGLSSLSDLLEENVIGIQILRAFNREEVEAQRWRQKNGELYWHQVYFTETWSTYFPLMAVEVACCTAIMLWQGAPLVANHTITIGTIVALNGYILMLALPVQRLGFVVQQYSTASTSAARVFEILDTPIELGDAPDAIELPRIEGYVRFEDVSLRYRRDGPEALKHINFETRPNQVIGLVGPTGGGKSSIANVLARFYDVSGGRVTIDGYDVRSVTMYSLRRQIGMVLQETLLFTASIRDNIRYGRPEATDDEIIAAAKAADAHRFIMETPQGYDTEIGERGVTLSGGQRQRIAIARALLIDPRILILDDAWSSVDTRTENSIQVALSKLMAGRVTFIIAQRLTSIQHADQILVIAGGEIIQRGTHDALIATPGPYQDIYREQMEDQERARREAESTTLPSAVKHAAK